MKKYFLHSQSFIKICLVVSVFVVSLFLSFSFSIVPVTHAASLGSFGGRVTRVTYCPCVYYFGVVLTIDDVSTHQPLKLFYSIWFSRLWANYNIWAPLSQYVLGGYIPGAGVCLEQNGYYCKTVSGANPDGMIDSVRGIGSSI
jgi:hypothetical protein